MPAVFQSALSETWPSAMRLAQTSIRIFISPTVPIHKAHQGALHFALERPPNWEGFMESISLSSGNDSKLRRMVG